jgi:hypothetical protein
MASLGSYASPQAVLISLVASVFLLVVRSWSATNGVVLSRLVGSLLVVVIAALVALFVALVFIRFRTIA